MVALVGLTDNDIGLENVTVNFTMLRVAPTILFIGGSTSSPSTTYYERIEVRIQDNDGK